MTSSSALTRPEASYTELLLSECRPEHLGGLVDLLRFGVASSGSESGACVAVAWLLNSARFASLPAVSSYQYRDDTNFQHYDADWLEQKAKLDHRQPLSA